MPVVVVTDSVAALPSGLANELGIEVVSLWVNDGERNERDLDLDPDSFYARLKDLAHLPTSSQPSVESLAVTFQGIVERGADVVGVFISQKMSGTLDTARIAADMVLAKLPQGRIELLDSESNSMQEGFAAVAAAKAAQAGKAVESCISAASETIRRTRYLFTPASLEYLRKGGRIGAASAFLGGLLQIRPILTVEHGETTPFARVRTQQRALETIAQTFADEVREHGLVDVVVHYIGDKEPAERFAAEKIEPVAGRKVRIVPVSPVIGVHVGQAVAVVYWTETPLR